MRSISIIFLMSLMIISCSSNVRNTTETNEREVVVSEKNQVGHNFKVYKNSRF